MSEFSNDAVTAPATDSSAGTEVADADKLCRTSDARARSAAADAEREAAEEKQLASEYIQQLEAVQGHTQQAQDAAFEVGRRLTASDRRKSCMIAAGLTSGGRC